MPGVDVVPTNLPVGEKEDLAADKENLYTKFIRPDGTLDYEGYGRALREKLETGKDVDARADDKVYQAGFPGAKLSGGAVEEDEVVDAQKLDQNIKEYDKVRRDFNTVKPQQFLRDVGGSGASRLLSMTKPAYVTAVGIAQSLSGAKLGPEPRQMQFHDEKGGRVEATVSLTDKGNIKIVMPYMEKLKGRNARNTRTQEMIIPAHEGERGGVVADMDKVNTLASYYQNEFVPKTNEEHESKAEYAELLNLMSDNADKIAAGKYPKFRAVY
jgi:hypothetical protein